MTDQQLKKYRYFLKDSIRKTIDFSQTDQSKGIPPLLLKNPARPVPNGSTSFHPKASRISGSSMPSGIGKAAGLTWTHP